MAPNSINAKQTETNKVDIFTVDDKFLLCLQAGAVEEERVEGTAQDLGVVVAWRRRETQHARRDIAVQRDLRPRT